MVFHRRLSDSESLRISKTLLGILADLNHTVVGIVSIRPSITNSSNPPAKPFGAVPSVQVTIGITVTIKFHNSLSTLARSKLLSIFSFCPVGWGCRTHGLLLCSGVRHPPTCLQDMTLNNLMVRFQ